jgi:enoyl-CoA hydratase/carnithine racemase
MSDALSMTDARVEVDAVSAGTVRFEDHYQVVHVVLARPDKMNAINRSVLAGIRRSIAIAQEIGAVKAIIFRGDGRGFSAGGDLAEVAGLVRNSPEFSTFLDYWHESLDLVERCPLPTIAAVHGLAFAGGFELTQVCDFVVIGESTLIGDQHANLGLFPAGGSTQRLPRLVGPRVAKWILMTGAVIDPARALEMGLVNDVVKEDQVLARAEAIALGFAEKSRAASAAIKSAVAIGEGLPVRAAIAAEREIALAHMASDDVQIGLAAFRTRGRPTFG